MPPEAAQGRGELRAQPPTGAHPGEKGHRSGGWPQPHRAHPGKLVHRSGAWPRAHRGSGTVLPGAA